MSDSHAKLPKLFWIQLALAAVIGIIFLLTPSKHGEDEHGAATKKVAAAAKNLAPVGAVAVNDKKAGAGAGKARSGEEVYKASCQACHATGVANAPKLDDKAAWEPRVATGFAALMNTAINGKGAMPAKGGNPAITDAEIEATVIYMTDKAGFNLKSEKKTESVPVTTEQTQAVKTEEKSAPTETQTKQAQVKSMTNTVAEIVAPVAVVSPATPAAPSAPVAPSSAPKTTEAPSLSTVEPAAIKETVASATTSNNNAEGEKIYKTACFACHATGVAGSPKLGDKAAWVARIATGNEALYQVALKGKGAMPPKGGNMSLSDDAVKAAVDYMTANSQ